MVRSTECCPLHAPELTVLESVHGTLALAKCELTVLEFVHGTLALAKCVWFGRVC